MKYTLEGFSQESALSMQATITENGRTKTIKLDLIDLTILRWIVDFYPSMKKTIIEGTEYAWLDYSAFVEDMPLLGLSNQSLYKRCMKMVQLGVLKHKTVRSKGTFSYYGFGPAYSRLVGNSRASAQAPTHAQDAWGDTVNMDTTQFQDPEPQPLLEEPQTHAQSKEPDPTEEVVEHLNSRAGTHYRSTTSNTRKLVKADSRKASPSRTSNWSSTRNAPTGSTTATWPNTSALKPSSARSSRATSTPSRCHSPAPTPHTPPPHALR